MRRQCGRLEINYRLAHVGKVKLYTGVIRHHQARLRQNLLVIDLRCRENLFDISAHFEVLFLRT